MRKELEELTDVDFPDCQFFKDFPLMGYSTEKGYFEPVSKEEYNTRRKKVLETRMP